MKVFDLNSNKIKFGNNVQNNIKILLNKLGRKFVIQDIIKGKVIKIPALFVRTCGHIPYYYLIYDIKDRNNALFPFKIDFISEKNILDNDCYIANIHKTDKISGTNMMNLVIKILRKLNVDTVYLHDGAAVEFSDGVLVDLTFYKLIEKGITFYQKFGFKFTINNNRYLIRKYGYDKHLNKFIIKYIDQFKKIKIQNIKKDYNKINNILNLVIANKDYDQLKIYKYNRIRPYLIDQKKNVQIVENMTAKVKTAIRILENSKKKYIYELLIDLWNTNQSDYIELDNIINDSKYIIKYHDMKIISKFNKILDMIYIIKNRSTFTLQLRTGYN